MIGRFLFVGGLLGFASLSFGSGATMVSASGGSVSGTNTASGTSPWHALDGTAKTATISYTHNISASGVSNTTAAPPQFKCINSSGAFAPTIFAGDHASVSNNGSSARVDVNGFSTFSNSTGSTAPTYYQATWTTTTQASGVAESDSGTYDPWSVHYKDLSDPAGLNLMPGQHADLYYQTSLLGGWQNNSGFDLTAGSTGYYGYNVGLTQGGNNLHFFDVKVNSNGQVDINFNRYDNFDVYLLGANAHNDKVTPSDRIKSPFGTLVTGGKQLGDILSGDLNPDGSLIQTLDFGIVYKNFEMPTSTDPDQVLFSWTTDTFAHTSSVPEPGTYLGLGVGALVLMRRRAKK